MKHIKIYTIIGIVFVLIIGSVNHFLYNWSKNNYFIGLFTPINESIWEHMKLLFFPMLIYSFIMIIRFKQKYSSIISALCLGILIGTFLIPFLYYTYTFITGRNFFILDISIFILSIIIAFFLSYKFILSYKLKAYTYFLCILVCTLFVCFLVFTYSPPNISLFQQ